VTLKSSGPQGASFDYAVIGGGPVGAVMALGLADQGHSVALIERDVPQPVSNSLGVDPRTVALSVKSRELLNRYDAWPADCVSGFAAMEVWEDCGTSVLGFGAADVGQETLGHIAEVGPWRSQLLSALEDSDVTCFAPCTLTAIEEENGRWRLALAHGDESRPATVPATVFATTVIAADGAGSVVRRSLGVAMQLTDTGQSALAFAARMERPHEHTAYQRFLAQGPLAELARLSAEQLAAQLEHASEARLGRVVEVLPAVRFPLRQGVISNFAPEPGVVFVGDAARVVHPLAGQGVNLGFEDVRALLECTAGATGRSDARTLQRFARLRRARSRLAVSVMGALSSAYASQSPGMLWARNSVTRALGELDLVRRALVLEAMGLGVVARSS